jgi:hypothetical protein
LIVYHVLLAETRELVWLMAVPAWLGAWGPPLGFSALTLVVLWFRLQREDRTAQSGVAA